MSFREKLRAQKECSLYAGCLVFEVLFGVTYSVAGAFRLAVHYSNECEYINSQIWWTFRLSDLIAN